MTEDSGKYLDAFASWLRTLGQDAELLVEALSDGEAPVEARRAVIGGVNYLFKSLDLIPDGIDDIGYLDDAFVLRMTAKKATDHGLQAGEGFVRLAREAELVCEFLADVGPRLEAYVAGLRAGAARGRTVDEILNDGRMLEEFQADVARFAQDYRAPSFSRDPKNLVKLNAFFDAKLPRV